MWDVDSEHAVTCGPTPESTVVALVFGCYLDDLEPELRLKCCQKRYTNRHFDDKAEYYILNWAAKFGPESGFVNTARSYKCCREE